jgi:hypothetical protein
MPVHALVRAVRELLHPSLVLVLLNGLIWTLPLMTSFPISALCLFRENLSVGRSRFYGRTMTLVACR